MFAVGRKSEPDVIALARGIIIAEAVVWKVAQLIVAEIENRDGLAGARLLRAITLVKQRGIAAVRTERDRRRKTVGAGEVTRNRQRQSLACRQMDAPRTFRGPRDDKNDQEQNRREERDSQYLFLDLFHWRNLEA